MRRIGLAMGLLCAASGVSALTLTVTSTADSTFANWIEQLAAEGIIGGCGGGNDCPLNNVHRGQMAAFPVNAFSLP